ncbi:G patch domain-containing protein 8 [Amborella trichopoda]|uniref:Uncharacterized protein n=1 Tax=Amborella trichopoda TaxID=13333 RepID=W1NZN0_AMBTC|nr:G patch domain-containing protein 8 [Amborella trichopoda]XP_020519801.1 G patch domain-containing protein 8 [Amborella trichopoda]XP_020519802.1 G patch domain-containing protein 8 [Amborella trichopoda]ERN01133.1 hypothetical protein AMTR_s00002p00207490 [Amborella trichopoda]|eukprot:XP_006838564.1 G patch domain-containing protein 8 [Amborella trichopoda]
MDASNGASKSISNTEHVPRQPVFVDGVPGSNSNPSHSLNASMVQHAIALQQYQFQQSLATQQLLLKQHTAANATNIRAATELAAARAAEISKLLNSETPNVVDEKGGDVHSPPIRKRSRSKSRELSPSLSESSKLKSEHPVGYRSEHFGRERHSEYSSYYDSRYGDHVGYSRSIYRHQRNRSYWYHRRSPIRSRMRRPHSRSRPQRYYHGRSPSPRYCRTRSPSPYRERRSSYRGLERHKVSKSPISSSSLSSGPRGMTNRNIEKTTHGERSSYLRQSPSKTDSSLWVGDDREGPSVSCSKKNRASDVSSEDSEEHEEESKPLREELSKRRVSTPSPMSQSSSSIHSVKVSDPKETYAGELASGASTLSKVMSLKAIGVSEDENEQVTCAPPKSGNISCATNAIYVTGSSRNHEGLKKLHGNEQATTCEIQKDTSLSAVSKYYLPAGPPSFEYACYEEMDPTDVAKGRSPYVLSPDGNSDEPRPEHERGNVVGPSFVASDGLTGINTEHEMGCRRDNHKMSRHRSHSRGKRKKHGKKHQKRHRREESEDDRSTGEDGRSQVRKRKHRKKVHKRCDRQDSKRLKRKLRDMSYSSLSEDSSSSY